MTGGISVKDCIKFRSVGVITSDPCLYNSFDVKLIAGDHVLYQRAIVDYWACVEQANLDGSRARIWFDAGNDQQHGCQWWRHWTAASYIVTCCHLVTEFVIEQCVLLLFTVFLLLCFTVTGAADTSCSTSTWSYSHKSNAAYGVVFSTRNVLYVHRDSLHRLREPSCWQREQMWLLALKWLTGFAVYKIITSVNASADHWHCQSGWNKFWQLSSFLTTVDFPTSLKSVV